MSEEIKRLVSQLREKLESSENFTELNSVLKKIELGNEDILDSLRIANSESKKRKEKIRDELTPEITTLRDRVEELEKLGDNTEMETEIKSLREFKQGQIKKQTEQFVGDFGKITEHANFDKAKSKFILPEKAENEESYDFTKLPQADMEKNITALNDLNSLEYFSTNDEKPPTPPKVDGSRFRTTENDQKTEIKNPNDLKESWRANITADL